MQRVGRARVPDGVQHRHQLGDVSNPRDAAERAAACRTDNQRQPGGADGPAAAVQPRHHVGLRRACLPARPAWFAHCVLASGSVLALLQDGANRHRLVGMVQPLWLAPPDTSAPRCAPCGVGCTSLCCGRFCRCSKPGCLADQQAAACRARRHSPHSGPPMSAGVLGDVESRKPATLGCALHGAAAPLQCLCLGQHQGGPPGWHPGCSAHAIRPRSAHAAWATQLCAAHRASVSAFGSHAGWVSPGLLSSLTTFAGMRSVAQVYRQSARSPGGWQSASPQGRECGFGGLHDSGGQQEGWHPQGWLRQQCKPIGLCCAIQLFRQMQALRSACQCGLWQGRCLQVQKQCGPV